MASRILFFFGLALLSQAYEFSLYDAASTERLAAEESEGVAMELLQSDAKLSEATLHNPGEAQEHQREPKKVKGEAPSSLAQVAVASQAPSGFSIKACIAEFIAMTLFVVIGCGSAMGIAKVEGAAWILQVSLTFGFAITSLAYTIGHYSGGQINCAVTLGLVVAGQLNIVQAIGNFIAQMIGSVFGAFILTIIYPADKDLTGGLGSNGVSPDFSWTSAILGEVLMTFLLVYVVLETAKNPAAKANSALACVAIGFAVFLAHSVLIPIDGCSINPTRSFGPEVVARMLRGKKDSSDFPIFFFAPLVGAVIAALVWLGMSA